MPMVVNKVESDTLCEPSGTPFQTGTVLSHGIVRQGRQIHSAMASNLIQDIHSMQDGKAQASRNGKSTGPQ